MNKVKKWSNKFGAAKLYVLWWLCGQSCCNKLDQKKIRLSQIVHNQKDLFYNRNTNPPSDIRSPKSIVNACYVGRNLHNETKTKKVRPSFFNVLELLPHLPVIPHVFETIKREKQTSNGEVEQKSNKWKKCGPFRKKAEQ